MNNISKASYVTPDVDVIVVPSVDVITSSNPGKDQNQGEWDPQ